MSQIQTPETQIQTQAQTQAQQIEMEIIQTQIKQSKRPTTPEEVCARFNATVGETTTINGAIYIACIGDGRIILTKTFKARDYLFIKSLMALEISGIDKIIDILTKAKKKYEEEVEAKRIAEIIRRNPELIKVIKKYLNL